MLFLSTPSARRATYDVRNPLKLRQISIHTLREEGDALYDEVGRFQSDFYPRPPRGGRLYSADGGFGVGRISIHALREEGDKRELHPRRTSRNFYPRPPRGGRPPATATVTAKAPAFLSTPSARRATSSGPSETSPLEVFLSTPSARRATPVIATHALPL